MPILLIETCSTCMVMGCISVFNMDGFYTAINIFLDKFNMPQKLHKDMITPMKHRVNRVLLLCNDEQLLMYDPSNHQIHSAFSS